MPGATFSVMEAAKYLGVSRSQVYVLLQRGVLPKVPNLGRVCRIPRRAVEQLVESSMEASA